MRANKFPTSIILLRGTDISSLETDAIRGDLTVSDQIFTDNFDAIQRDELLRDLAQVWLFHRLVQEDDPSIRRAWTDVDETNTYVKGNHPLI